MAEKMRAEADRMAEEMLKMAPAVSELQRVSQKYSLNLTNEEAKSVVDAAIRHKTERGITQSVRTQLFARLAEKNPAAAITIEISSVERQKKIKFGNDVEVQAVATAKKSGYEEASRYIEEQTKKLGELQTRIEKTRQPEKTITAQASRPAEKYAPLSPQEMERTLDRVSTFNDNLTEAAKNLKTRLNEITLDNPKFKEFLRERQGVYPGTTRPITSEEAHGIWYDRLMNINTNMQNAAEIVALDFAKQTKDEGVITYVSLIMDIKQQRDKELDKLNVRYKNAIFQEVRGNLFLRKQGNSELNPTDLLANTVAINAILSPMYAKFNTVIPREELNYSLAVLKKTLNDAPAEFKRTAFYAPTNIYVLETFISILKEDARGAFRKHLGI